MERLARRVMVSAEGVLSQIVETHRGVPHLVSVELSVVAASSVVAATNGAVAGTPAVTSDQPVARSQSVPAAHTTQISLSGLIRVVQRILSASAAR
jgi:energy-converting hydrogenase Eha subunit A